MSPANGVSEFQKYIERIAEEFGPRELLKSLDFFSLPIVITTEGYVVAANDAFIKLSGYSYEEVLDVNVLQLTHSEDWDKLPTLLQEDKLVRQPLRFVTKNGDTKFTQVSPRMFRIGNKKYRLSEVIDNTPIIESHLREVRALRNTAEALCSTIEQRDPYTRGHLTRVANISVKVAEEMGLEKRVIENIMIGAQLHDIGKISVPIEILTKPGRLDNEEWAIVKKHPVIGYNILLNLEFDDAVKNIVLHHHENVDGSGYPNGLQGEEIILEAAIVAVADNLDAISGVRPYRPSRSLEGAIEIMTSQAHKFHKEVLKIAERMVHAKQFTDLEFMPEL